LREKKTTNGQLTESEGFIIKRSGGRSAVHVRVHLGLDERAQTRAHAYFPQRAAQLGGKVGETLGARRPVRQVEQLRKHSFLDILHPKNVFVFMQLDDFEFIVLIDIEKGQFGLF